MQMPNSAQSKILLLVLLQKKCLYTCKNIVTKLNLDEFLRKLYEQYRIEIYSLWISRIQMLSTLSFSSPGSLNLSGLSENLSDGGTTSRKDEQAFLCYLPNLLD